MKTQHNYVLAIFRGAEIFPKFAKSYDESVTLLKRDVWKSSMELNGKTTKVLNVRLKTSKTAKSRSQGEVIQLYETRGRMCPIAAVEKYMAANKKGKRNK